MQLPLQIGESNCSWPQRRDGKVYAARPLDECCIADR